MFNIRNATLVFWLYISLSILLFSISAYMELVLNAQFIAWIVYAAGWAMFIATIVVYRNIKKQKEDNSKQS